MKNLSRIRMFLIICFFVCISSFFVGYFIHSKAMNRQDMDLLQQNRTIDIVEQEIENRDKMDEDSQLESMNVLNAYEYVLVEEEGYIAVYYADKKTLYSETDILVDSLAPELQNEIKKGKYIYTVEELYDFLENHSS